MTRLGQSPPSMCLCGHEFHRGPCELTDVCCEGTGREHYYRCHCPNGELDGDR